MTQAGLLTLKGLGGSPSWKEYGFDKSWTEEQRRTRLIERCYDQATTARLARLGVSPGWKCLEVGAGNG